MQELQEKSYLLLICAGNILQEIEALNTVNSEIECLALFKNVRYTLIRLTIVKMVCFELMSRYPVFTFSVLKCGQQSGSVPNLHE